MKKSLIGVALLGAASFIIQIAGIVPVTAQQTATTSSPSTPAATVTGTDSQATTTTTKSDATTDSWDGVRTVVVTATRQETEIAKTGTSISVISNKEIERKQYRNVADTLQEVPGVNVMSYGSPGQASTVMIRGTTTKENSVLMDGRALPFNLSGSNSIEMLSLANVDRVEVARGPSSSVSGGPALGGVINLISRDGRGKAPETEVYTEAGSFNTIREGVSSAGSVGNFDYSTGAVRMDAQFPGGNGDYRSFGNNTKLGYQINPDLYFDTHVLYSQDDSGTPNAVQYHNPTANTLRELWGVSPGLTWQTTEIWKQSIYYGHYQYRQVYENSSNPYPADPFGYNDPANRVQVNTDQVSYQSHVQVFETWGLTAGADAKNESYYYKLNQIGSDYSGSWPYPDIPAGTTPLDGHDTQTGYFAESQWEILPGWNLINNGRFDHYSDFGDAFTYRAATSYEIPTWRTLLHTNYGTSYAPPSASEVATFWGGSSTLKPEKSKGYEAGVTQPFWGDKGSVYGTWFHNDVDQMIVWSLDPSTFAYTPSNVSHAVLEGVETGFTLKPIKQVKLNLGYTNLSALRQADSVQNYTSRLAYRPRHTLNASVSYMPIDPLTFTLGGAYNADRVDSSGKALEDYLNMRFTASWKINTYVEIYGRIENLTNDQYQEFPGYPTLDQAYYGGVKVTF